MEHNNSSSNNSSRSSINSNNNVRLRHTDKGPPPSNAKRCRGTSRRGTVALARCEPRHQTGRRAVVANPHTAVARGARRARAGRGRASRTHLLLGAAEVGVVHGAGVEHAVVGAGIGERGLAANAQAVREALVALHLVLEAIGLAAVLVRGVPVNTNEQPGGTVQWDVNAAHAHGAAS